MEIADQTLGEFMNNRKLAFILVGVSTVIIVVFMVFHFVDDKETPPKQINTNSKESISSNSSEENIKSQNQFTIENFKS